MDWTETINKIIDSKLAGKSDLVSEMKYRKFLEDWAHSNFFCYDPMPYVHKIWADNVDFPLLLASLKQENNLSEYDLDISLDRLFRHCTYEDIKLLFDNGLQIKSCDFHNAIENIHKNGLNCIEKVELILNSFKEEFVLHRANVPDLFRFFGEKNAIKILEHKNVLVDKDCFTRLERGQGYGMESEKSIKTLISKGASLEPAISFNLGYKESVKLFIKLGAPVKYEDYFNYLYGVNEDKEMVDLFDKYHPTLKNEINTYAKDYFFCYGAFTVDPHTSKFLIENGADINMRNEDGDTLLFVAAFHSYGELDHIKFLLDKGLNPCEKNKNNEDIVDFAKKGKDAYASLSFYNMKLYLLDNFLYNCCASFKYKPEEFHHLSLYGKLRYFVNHIYDGAYKSHGVSVYRYFSGLKPPKGSTTINQIPRAIELLNEWFIYLKGQDEVIEFLENAQKQYLLKQQNKQNETEKE